LSQQPTAEPALLRDISECGLACTSPERIAEMTKVALEFTLPGALETHFVEGAVVRCEPLDKPPMPAKGKPPQPDAKRADAKTAASKWDLAVFFTTVPPKTRAALRSYVSKNKR
jgi:hypothetical protein